MNSKFVLALLLALALDAVDYTVGWIPIAGDILDVFGVIVLLPLIGVYALIGVVELFPIIGDLLPVFTGAVLASRTKLLGEQE